MPAIKLPAIKYEPGLDYDIFVDGTPFGTVYGYLSNPASQIDYVIHVRDRAMLPLLAKELVRSQSLYHQQRLTATPLFDQLLNDGGVKVSPRLLNSLFKPQHIIKAQAIDPQATSQVIFLPPFYVAHTPGVFENLAALQCESNQFRPSLSQPVKPTRLKM